MIEPPENQDIDALLPVDWEMVDASRAARANGEKGENVQDLIKRLQESD